MVNRSKAQSLWLVTAAYVVAVGGAGAAWLLYGPSATGRLWLDGFTADVIATLVVFVFSRAYRNSSFYDASGASSRRCCSSTGGPPGRSAWTRCGAGSSRSSSCTGRSA